MQNPKFRHLCNAYCSEAEHCDVFFTNPLVAEAAEGALRQALCYYADLRVTRVAAAREARPAPAALDTEYIVRGPKPATQAWLVWWLRRGSATVER